MDWTCIETWGLIIEDCIEGKNAMGQGSGSTGRPRLE